MYNVFVIALGGAIGAVSRYGMTRGVARLSSDYSILQLPIANLSVHVLCSFLMGIACGIFAQHSEISEAMKLFLMVGLLGGFTTFSNFSLEAFSLIEKGVFGQAALYILLSVVLSIVGLFLGLMMTGYGGTS